MRKLLILLIQAYRYLLSPLLGPHCRYHPSCSSYAQMALERHGAVRGGSMAVKRLCRCHPWHEGGFDPVPEKKD
ncbi:MAG: membrane protein insertion efficiency factor YidD [Gammaproteobacteria bacterium]|nr:membrane protein insertion efficiency factor YidD [Gammaproteobacteria bacterium]